MTPIITCWLLIFVSNPVMITLHTVIAYIVSFTVVIF